MIKKIIENIIKKIKYLIGKIKCFFGFHDFGGWIFLGYIHADHATKNARMCKRERCAAVETLTLRRDI